MKTLLLLFFLFFYAWNSLAQNSIYVLSNSPNDLYVVDLENCSRTFIGNTNQQFGDIAFTEDGRLWGITGGFLYEINPQTAVSDSVGFTNTNAVSLVGWNDSILLAESNFSLYAINVNTALASYIDTIGYQASGDLTWYDNDLYIVTGFPGIIKMVLNPSLSGLQAVTPINALDLPTCEGAVTANFDNDFNAVVGFNGENVIKICRLDGSYEMLCPNLNPGGTPGAASLRLAVQNPLPATCNQTNNLVELKNARVYVSPNPASDQISISWNDFFKKAPFSYQILDGSGRILVRGQGSPNEQSLDISFLEAGSFFLSISSSEGDCIFPFSVLK